jgi:hypothetical protein
LAHADDINIVGENIDTIQKNSNAQLDACKEVGLEVNPEKTEYMLVSMCQEARQREGIKIGNRSLESEAQFKYLGKTLTVKNCIHEEIKSRLNSGNACYHSVQSLSSSRLLFRNIRVKIYKTIILPVVLYGCETWYFTVREEHRLKVFENRVLRTIFRHKSDEVTGEWRKLHSEELHNFYSPPDIIRQVKANEVGEKSVTHGRGEKIVQGFGGKSRRKEATWKTKA